jgi:hypothetical protein
MLIIIIIISRSQQRAVALPQIRGHEELLDAKALREECCCCLGGVDQSIGSLGDHEYVSTKDRVDDQMTHQDEC